MGPVLVTGSSGFIGQHLVDRLLRDGFSLKVLIRGEEAGGRRSANVEIAEGDIRDAESVRKAVTCVESVFHLAGKVHDLEELDDTGEHGEVTLRGTCNLLTAAAESGVKRFVFLSSLSVYGTASQEVRDEGAACNPISAYGKAKFEAEQYLFNEGARFGIHVCCLRPAMVYGPGCKGNLPRMIKMIDRGLFPFLPDVGNRRSMVHVSDLVEAAILGASTPVANGQRYIVTDGRPYSTRELYEMIRRGLGKRIPRWHVPIGMLKGLSLVGDVVGRLRGRRVVFDSDALEKLTGNAWFSSERISRELGYRPRMTFEEALPEMIAWYRETQARSPC